MSSLLKWEFNLKLLSPLKDNSLVETLAKSFFYYYYLYNNYVFFLKKQTNFGILDSFKIM